MVRFFSKEFRSIWNEDKGLTTIFIVLCISNFLIIPFFEQLPVISLLIKIVWLILLITGITTLSKNRLQVRNLTIIPVLLVTVNILQLVFNNQIISYIEFAVRTSVTALLIVMVLIKVFESGPVSFHKVIGSIVAYMLIGNLWADTYEFIYINVPGSFQFPAVDTQAGVAASSFLYLSFTTLTTTGFGDILPTIALTRTVVIIEQLIGVLYPVVLIGRIVSLVTADTAKPPEKE